MSEYDKELQTGTEEFEEATRPLRSGKTGGDSDDQNSGDHDTDDQKADADSHSV